MDYARLPFAGGKCQRVISPKIHQFFTNHINQLYGVALHTKQMPAPNPVSLLRKDLPRLGRFAYGVSAKTNGTRYLMLLMRTSDQQVLMIDRAYNVHAIQLHCEPEAFNGIGTLLDGELVQLHDGTWKYLIFDCVALAGQSLTDLKLYTDRLDAARHFCTRYFHPQIQDPFVIDTKRFYAMRNLDRMWNSLSQLDHPIDGLIFTPLTEKIKTGRQFSMLKWKWNTEHTIDARVICTDPSQYRLQIVDGKNFIDWSILEGEFAQECQVLGIGPHNGNGQAIVECRYDPRNGQWHVDKLRNDKSVPNTVLTVDMTMQNIAEDITIEELFSIAGECMQRYNDRQRKARTPPRSRSRSQSGSRSRSRSRSQSGSRSSSRSRSPSSSWSRSRSESPPPRCDPISFVHPDRLKHMLPSQSVQAQTKAQGQAQGQAQAQAQGQGQAQAQAQAQRQGQGQVQALPEAGELLTKLNSLLTQGLLDSLASKN